MKKVAPSVESILNAVIDAIITIDETGTMLSVNPAVRKVFGYAPEELIGKNVSVLMPQPYSREHGGYIQKYLKTGKANIIGIGREVTAVRKDGSVFPVYLGVSEGHRSGNRRFFTGVIRDVSERYRLERMVLEVTKKEQRRIGQELHDGIAQHLTHTAIVAKVLEKKLTQKSAPVAREVKRVVSLINQAIVQTRELAQGLYGLETPSEDLASSLKRLLSDTEKTVGVRCRFLTGGAALDLAEGSAAHLYRIAREAVNNAVKHGKGKNIWIRLHPVNEREMEFIVDNDGRPFSKSAKEAGLGIRIMRSRAAILNTSLAFSARPKGGTRVSCIFPVRP